MSCLDELEERSRRNKDERIPGRNLTEASFAIACIIWIASRASPYSVQPRAHSCILEEHNT